MTNRHTQRNTETYACKRYTHREAKWKNRLRKLASSCIREVEKERGGGGGGSSGRKLTETMSYVTSVSLLLCLSDTAACQIEFPIIIKASKSSEETVTCYNESSLLGRGGMYIMCKSLFILSHIWATFITCALICENIYTLKRSDQKTHWCACIRHGFRGICF